MKNDFSDGRVKRNIIIQAVPLFAAQLVHLLYNIVDRIYIGHMEGTGTLALTGIGIVFPLTTLISAVTLLFGSGGTPIFSIARGARDESKAEKVLGHCFMLITASSVILFIVCYLFRRPILFLFGAEELSYQYADEYLRFYLLGTFFAMFTTGMNGFINAQGYPQIGMGTTLLGAGINLVLDPLFIFGLNMGVAGAAIATVISQGISALWVLLFFIGKKNMYRIRKRNMRLQPRLVGEIVSLGLTGFIMNGTNCLVQIVCNKCLLFYGSELYVGAMTIVNSVREILSLPVNSLTVGASPVLSYNFGARKYSLVKKGIRFTVLIGLIYTVAAWAAVIAVPEFLVSIFTPDPEMVRIGANALRIYFFGFCFMAFQFGGQTCFTALRCPRRAIFFSLLRKAFIVVPLTIFLPMMGYGTDGVFMAEPISNLIGGLACFTTMYFTLYRRLPNEDMPLETKT